MAEEESIVLKPREPFSDALLPQSADELAKFMDEPLMSIAETITGALAAGPKAWSVMTGHIVQGILTGRLHHQVALEIKELRAKGRIPEDFADETKFKYGGNCAGGTESRGDAVKSLSPHPRFLVALHSPDGALKPDCVCALQRKRPQSLPTIFSGTLSQRRNTLRFLLPKKSSANIYFDRDLIVYARAVYLADQWKETDAAFRPLHTTYQNSHLRPKFRDLFDTFAILDVWNFAQPEQCLFLIEKHNATGDKIPNAIDEKITSELFIVEDFETAALTHAASGFRNRKLPTRCGSRDRSAIRVTSSRPLLFPGVGLWVLDFATAIGARSLVFYVIAHTAGALCCPALAKRRTSLDCVSCSAHILH